MVHSLIPSAEELIVNDNFRQTLRGNKIVFI